MRLPESVAAPCAVCSSDPNGLAVPPPGAVPQRPRSPDNHSSRRRSRRSQRRAPEPPVPIEPRITVAAGVPIADGAVLRPIRSPAHPEPDGHPGPGAGQDPQALDLASACAYICTVERRTRKIKRRLEKEGWYLARHGSSHDIYRRQDIRGIMTLPRQRTVSSGVARSIASKAQWQEDE